MPLSKFETAAQRLVEGSFKQLFGGSVEPLEVASRLARAMEDGTINGRSPDKFTVRLHPHDYKNLIQRLHIEAELAGYAARLAEQEGLRLSKRPSVILLADEKLRRHRLTVEAAATIDDDAPTMAQTSVNSQEKIAAAIAELDAYVLLQGRELIPLQKPLITLGRRSDNDIQLSSPAISRYHAQIRWRYGRFTIYDISGRGRLSVNGHAVLEWPLQAGDMILLSDQTLIYGEEQERSTAVSDGDTQIL